MERSGSGAGQPQPRAWCPSAAPPNGSVENISFLLFCWEEMLRSQGRRNGRQALTHYMHRAILMNVCPAEYAYAYSYVHVHV